MKHTIEFIENGHIYVIDGIPVKSITQVLKGMFGGMYSGVSPTTLKVAADRGTAIHKAIEDYCNGNVNHPPKTDTSKEVYNFDFLCKKHNLKPMENEVVVVLDDDNGEPIAAGRLDLVMERDGMLGVVDIKSTYKLNKDYLFYQLNLYRMAYMQTYDKDIEWLGAMHLREDKRKFVEIPIAWEKAKEILTYDTDI